jgi:hypothetical protein
MLWGFNQETAFAKIDASKYKLCFGFNEYVFSMLFWLLVSNHTPHQAQPRGAV